MLRLIRFMSHPDMGTFGELYFNDEFIGYTVEQPWKNNKSFTSCVPHGTYKLEEWHSKKHPDTFCLFNPGLNVYLTQQPDPSSRYACLIHPANWARDVQGCIGIGENIAVMDNLMAVTSSRSATKRALQVIKDHNIDQLEIQWREHV